MAMEEGADELDMPLHVGALKDGREEDVLEDLRGVRQAVPGALLKVILETALLTRDEKITACRICQEAGADYVKTSTGTGPGGATVAGPRTPSKWARTLLAPRSVAWT